MQGHELREYIKSYFDDFVQQYTAAHPQDKYIVSEIFWIARSNINALSEEEIRNLMKQDGIPAKCIALNILENLAGNRLSADESSEAFFRLHLTVIDEKSQLGLLSPEQFAFRKTVAEYLRRGGDPNDSVSLTQFVRQREQELDRAAAPEQKKTMRLFSLICIAFFFAFVGMCVMVSDDSASTSGPEQSHVYDTALTPVPISNGHIIDSPDKEALAPLSVSTRGDRSYYIVLKPIDSSGSPMSFFVRGGCDAEVHVPLGNYEIYYATGENWYGKSDLFGYNTAYFRCADTFLFYDDGEYYQGWTLELYTQSDGNLATDYISAADFPG